MVPMIRKKDIVGTGKSGIRNVGKQGKRSRGAGMKSGGPKVIGESGKKGHYSFAGGAPPRGARA